MRRPWLLPVLLALVAAVLGVRAGARGQGARAAAASAIVFPRGESRLRFDHATAEHRALACERCHAGARESRRADDLLMPAEEACLPCHADEITRDAPAAERCGVCHEGYGEGGPAVVPRSVHPTPRLRFSHAAHRSEPCARCHAGVGDPLDRADRHLPTMRSCFECHGGPAPTASSACTTCHLMRPDGRMRAEYPEGWLNPPRWLHGMRHDREWMVRHRWIGADQGALCAECHTERECVDCHDGRVMPPRAHPNDWLTIHPQMARRDEPRCTSCHTTQTFCTECHARLGIALIAAPNVRSDDRFHPPAALWTRGPVLHAREARRSMTTCTSCHAERDCTTCHGALGVGAGISPHPPGFRSQCGRLLRANDRACRTCHADLSRVRALCD